MAGSTIRTVVSGLVIRPQPTDVTAPGSSDGTARPFSSAVRSSRSTALPPIDTLTVCSASPYAGKNASRVRPVPANAVKKPSIVDCRIGSAADMTARSGRRSQPARCSGVVLRTASSKAKFGAAVCVAATRDITSNHTAGRWRKLNGDSRVVRELPAIVDRITLIRPRSWYCGTQKTPRVSGPSPRSAAFAATSCTRFPWLMMTPLGSAVEPEVYCRNAGSSEPAGRCQSTGPAGSRSRSVRCHGRLGQLGVSRLNMVVTPATDRDRSYAQVVRIPRAPAFSAIALNVARSLRSLNGLGGYTGTGMTPAARQPRNASMKSSDGGYTRIARSPGAKPQPDNAPATRSAA